MANNVIKISRVGPATSLVDPLILPLTFLDLVWLNLNPTNRVNFYKLTESSSDSFYSVILPKLEQSLSLVLTHFLPLSGHIKWNPQDPKPHIAVLPQDAVSLTVAESDADFSHVSGKGLRHQTELHSLVSELPVSSDSASVLTLQITLFPKQGFSIGAAINHLAMDGKTVVNFFKSWAHISKYGTIPQDIHLPMLLDRTVIHIPPELESKIFQFPPYISEDKTYVRALKLPPAKDTEDVIKMTLELTQENVEKLKERGKSVSTRNDLHLSTFVVAYAYVLTCVVKARGDDGDRPVPFTFAADFRDRLDPPVPVNYFGNCALPISFSGDKAKTFLGEDGFVNAVKILSDSVKGLDSRGAESIWELYEEGLKNMDLGSAQKLSVSGSNKFGIYGCDFGWGRPVSTENVFFNKNLLFSMTEMRDETGGVEIGMCLQKCVMDGFISVFQNGL
uniref:BAHD acyltransferase n=2 Tax=Noccaea caerulescens TaxID=107243 RepID=A0A1J3G0E8_NOCCA